MCIDARRSWPWSVLIVAALAAPIMILAGCAAGGGTEIPPSLVGDWVLTRGHAPHTDVMRFGSDGTMAMFDDYAATQPSATPQFTDWSLSGTTLTMNGATGSQSATITWLNDNAVEVRQESALMARIYRKGYEPDGAILAGTPTALTYQEWSPSTIQLGDSHLYSFTATGSEWLYWRSDGGNVVLTVYEPDQETVAFPTTSEQDNYIGDSLEAGLTYYVVAECQSVDNEGDYRVGWDIPM